jgi:DNA-binding PadR family transcriptional regulator
MTTVKRKTEPNLRMQDLAVLGQLMERAQHGYDLKRRIDETLGNIARIPSATVYYTLHRLEKHGWVTCRRERKGNRPERSVHTITAAGRKEFHALVDRSLFTEERPYFAFDMALFFAPHVKPGTLREAVDRKLELLAGYRKRLKELEKKHPGRWPFHLQFIKERGMLHLGADETWYRSLRKKLAKK